ncbi:MAG: hypothetical protein V4598_12065 [Bdellovibrionota bacterium]
MRKLAIALLVMTSFSALAQNLDSDIQRKIERLNNLSIRGEISRLSYGEKTELDQTLKSALRIARDQDDRRPGPGPGGNNGGNGGRPGRRFETQAVVMVTDNIGRSKVLTLGGRNSGDILIECTRQISTTGFSFFSSVTMTSNNEAYESFNMNNAGGSAVCTNVVNRMRPGRPDWAFIDVSGIATDNIGRTASISLTGDRGEVLEQCQGAIARTGFSFFSKLTISVNRSSLIEQQMNNASGSGVCKKMTDVLNQYAP